MKAAEQWLIGATAGFVRLTNKHVEDVIRDIQADALRWALEQIAPRGSFAISAKLEELEDHDKTNT